MKFDLSISNAIAIGTVAIGLAFTIFKASENINFLIDQNKELRVRVWMLENPTHPWTEAHRGDYHN